MIYGSIPQSLCSNANINGGLTKIYGCDGVICPLGKFSDPGHATHSEGCKPCPDGTTTMYLGSSACKTFSDRDILAIIYDVVGSEQLDPLLRHRWVNTEHEVCTWPGVYCDENSEIKSIRLPLSGLGRET